MRHLITFSMPKAGSLLSESEAQSEPGPAGFQLHRARFAWVTALVILVFGFFSVTTGLVASQGATGGPAASVNPFVGTGHGPTNHRNINSGNEDTFPGPSLPFGMVQLSPDTQDRGRGYHYFQSEIHGFSMTHMSGAGCHSEGSVFFTATSGPVETAVSQFASPYSHSQESASPGYYRVQLSRWGINAQLTATDRTGLARFTFPAGKTANILVPISHTLDYTTTAHVQVVGNNQITGYVSDRGCGRNKQPYKVYFVMTFSRSFSSFGAWHGEQSEGPGKVDVGARSETQTRHGQWIGAYATWAASSHSQTITAKIGISYVDLAGAENNLKQEATGKNFKEARSDARMAWNKALNVIQVYGGTTHYRRVFYTALYHSLLMPSIFSDADGRYLGFDNKIHHVAPGHLIYATYSGWDIYRSQMPLLALIESQRMEDMARSIVLMYKQGGWIGRWPQYNLYTNVMAGSPLTVVLSMDWLDGLHGFDIRSAWEGMVKDATQAPPPGHHYHGEAEIEWINKLHYVPYDKTRYGSVSQIQEDCIAYASLYYLARDLGKTQDAKTFYQRAQYYRSVFDQQDRMFRPRYSNGQWVPNFDPSQMLHGFIEGTGWHYQWLEPEDMAWVIHAMGKNLFNQRLEKFFSYQKPGWYGQYYNPYNETDLEAPFEFNFSGEPWETQHAVRRVLRENYTLSPNGIPGNDDCGEMSSWAVMSMMGIYTVDPASLAYELSSPLFQKIVIHLHPPYRGKTFTVTTSAKPDTKIYIQKVKLNGQTQAKNWIPFGEISAGGTLQFTLGSKPNKSWGSAPDDAPPSLSDQQP